VCRVAFATEPSKQSRAEQQSSAEDRGLRSKGGRGSTPLEGEGRGGRTAGRDTLHRRSGVRRFPHADAHPSDVPAKRGSMGRRSGRCADVSDAHDAMRCMAELAALSPPPFLLSSPLLRLPLPACSDPACAALPPPLHRTEMAAAANTVAATAPAASSLKKKAVSPSVWEFLKVSATRRVRSRAARRTQRGVTVSVGCAVCRSWPTRLCCSPAVLAFTT
jgi:hypothetical protein